MSENLSLKEYFKNNIRFSEEDLLLAENLIHTKTFKKGDTAPLEDGGAKSLCFILEGLFRVFYIDPKTGKEINSYFYQENQFMVSLLIFTEARPCNYYIEALEDSVVDLIDMRNLKELYRESHAWEHFGRLLAEGYYREANKRTESFIFNSPEERYLNLIKKFPKIFQRTSLINIASYLGVESQSLSRIRKRLVTSKND